MALCPGFTKTEFHERMGVAAARRRLPVAGRRRPGRARRSQDFDKGKAFSIPSKRYKAIAAVTRRRPDPGCCSGSRASGRK